MVTTVREAHLRMTAECAAVAGFLCGCDAAISSDVAQALLRWNFHGEDVRPVLLDGILPPMKLYVAAAAFARPKQSYPFMAVAALHEESSPGSLRKSPEKR